MRSTTLRTALFSAGAAWLTFLSANAQIPATVTGDRTNLRAKPGFDGEILGSLKKGETVSVLGEVDGLAADGKTTRSWSKIALPAKVPVWVYGPLIDTKAKTVKAATVNLRAGPGKNYSELGKVSQGTSINIVRSMEDWIQIEPPAGVFAYVASSLIDTTAPVAPKSTAETKPAPAPVAETKPSTPAPAESKPAETAPAPTETKVADAPQLKPASNDSVPTTAATLSTPAPTPTPTPAPVPAPVIPSPAVPITTPATPITTAATPVPPAEVKPRHVIRDGVVGSAVSVQAPGYYELKSIHGEGVVDYLVSESSEIDLGKFRGKAVTISGEEWRDVRWKTPVLKVKSIEAAF